MECAVSVEANVFRMAGRKDSIKMRGEGDGTRLARSALDAGPVGL